MGNSVEICCDVCDYKKSFDLGVGMMYGPNNIIDIDSEYCILPGLIKSKKALAHIRELVEDKKAVLADDYGHEIYRCPKCRELDSRFFIHLDFEGGSYEVAYRCTKCKAKLKVIDYDIIPPEDEDEDEIKAMNLEKCPCPKCGKFKLYEDYSNEVRWD